MNSENRHVSKTKEQKQEEKKLKNLEKQKRKEKALQKVTDDDANTNLVKSTEKLSLDQSKVKEEKNNNQLKPKEAKVDIRNNNQSKPKEVKVIIKNNNEDKEPKPRKQNTKEVKTLSIFKHFYPDRKINTVKIHDDKTILPEIKKLGLAFESCAIRGSTKQCEEFIECMKFVVEDLAVKGDETLSQTFSNCLDSTIEFLNKCRPVPQTIRAAVNYLKHNISTLKEPDTERCRSDISNLLEKFRTERIEMAHDSIQTLAFNLFNGSNKSVLVYSYSQIVLKCILHAWKNRTKRDEADSPFQIIVVDTWPETGGRDMLRALQSAGVPCCRVTMASVTRIMTDIDLVLLGSQGVSASCCSVLASSGSASIANIARSCDKRVIVCCESMKFSTNRSMMSINQSCDPSLFIKSLETSSSSSSMEHIRNWRDVKNNITVFDIPHDVIEGHLVSGICCEFGMITINGVSFICRDKQNY